MEVNEDRYFLEIFTSLMLSNYPECLVEENTNRHHHSKKNMFRLDSKNMVIEVYRKSFYFQLDPKETRKFYQKSSWSIPLLKFGIHLTASTGKTYSYPTLRNYLGDNEDDILMTATYIFACVNYTIKFFESAVQELNSQKIKDMVSEHITTTSEIK
jgi:hypothetical protein